MSPVGVQEPFSRWFIWILLWLCPSGLRIAFLGTISKVASFEKFTAFVRGVGDRLSCSLVLKS